MKRIALFLLLAWSITPGWAAQTITNVNRGVTANDGTGDGARTAFGKLNSNDNFLYDGLTNEAALRQAGTNALAGLITAEATARQNTDDALTNFITIESVARQNATNDLGISLGTKTVVTVPKRISTAVPGGVYFNETWNRPNTNYIGGNTFLVEGKTNIWWKLWNMGTPDPRAYIYNQSLSLAQTYTNAGNAYLTLTTSNGIPATNTGLAGWTMVAYVTLERAGSFADSGLRVGWSTNTTIGTFGVRLSAPHRFSIVYNASSEYQWEGAPSFSYGKRYGVACRLETNGFTVAIQGDFADPVGFGLDSGRWYQIHRHTNALNAPIDGVLQPFVQMHFDSFAKVHSLTVYSNFNFGTYQAVLDDGLQRSQKTHGPALLQDRDGIEWSAWLVHNSDDSADAEIWGARRFSDGTWTRPTLIAGPGSGDHRYSFGTLLLISNSPAALYLETDNGFSNTVCHLKGLTASATGFVVGDVFELPVDDWGTIDTGNWDCMNPPAKMDGKLILAITEVTNLAATKTFAYVSTNLGSNWTVIGDFTSSDGETAFVQEQDGTLGAWLRASPYYKHATSTNGGTNWNAITTTTIPASSVFYGQRPAVTRLDDGRTVFLGDAAGYDRRNLIAYLVGSNQVVQQTVILSSVTNIFSVKYPAVMAHDGVLDYAWTADLSGSAGAVYFVERPLLEIFGGLSSASVSPQLEQPPTFTPAMPVLPLILAPSGRLYLTNFSSTNITLGADRLILAIANPLGYIPKKVWPFFVSLATDTNLNLTSGKRIPAHCFATMNGVSVLATGSATYFEIASPAGFLGHEAEWFAPNLATGLTTNPADWSNFKLVIEAE